MSPSTILHDTYSHKHECARARACTHYTQTIPQLLLSIIVGVACHAALVYTLFAAAEGRMNQMTLCALQLPIGLLPAVAAFLLPGSGYNRGGQEGKESGKALTGNGHHAAASPRTTRSRSKKE